METKALNLKMGLSILLVLVVMVSGCILSSDRTLGNYNLSARGRNPIIHQDIPIPAGTKNVTIVYTNMSVLDTPILKANAGYFRFSTFNDVAHREKDVDSELIHTNKTPINGNLTLTVKDAKKIRLTAMNSKGTIKVIAN